MGKSFRAALIKIFFASPWWLLINAGRRVQQNIRG